MNLTKEQQEIYDGKQGATLAKVMQTLVRYGELFGADGMVPVTSKYNHLVTSFGLKALAPVYELMNQLIESGNVSKQKFSADPRPLDPNVPSSFLQDFVFKNFMYSKQDDYEKQLTQLGIMEKDAYTCTCYMDEVGNTPAMGEVLSWSESSAVVYANSVLGARCNRNSGIIDLMGSVVGYVPCFGLLTDEGRKATWIVKIETTKKPEAQLLGSAIGMKVMADVPYIVGLDKWLGGELDDAAKTYLKDFGAATASNGAVGLYHVENITPEAVKYGKDLIAEDAKVYVVDDAELQRVYESYPVIWKKKDAKPKLCFMGCPHMSLQRADTATAAATAAANEPTAVTRKQVPDSGKQGGSRKTQNTQNGDDKAAQSVDWKGPTGKQPDLSQYSDLSVEVSLAKQRVYVKSGGQTIYTMIASTGVDDATPHGSYTIDTRGEHFYNAEEGMGADYWVQFYGSYLFHSVPTGEAFGDYLPEEGAKLGQPASHGCVRLTVADAQWFYDQVPDGTLVTIA